jgi:PPP family 3-phenylpropionic acid transporter
VNDRSQRLGLRLAALQAAAFVGVGVYLPFFPVWLQSKGLSPGMISFVLTLAIAVRVVATAPLMTLADRSFGPRGLLVVSFAVQLLLYPPLLFVENGWLIAGVVGCLAIFQSIVIPTNDLVATNAIRRHAGLQYGRIRIWGSISFLAASIACGYLVDAAGPRAVLWSLTALPGAAILVTLWSLPRELDEVRVGAGRRSNALNAALPRSLWFAIAGNAVTQATHAAINAFGSIHWRAIGFSDTAIGYLWATCVVTEVVVFFYFGKVVGRGSAAFGLLLAGSLAAAARFALMAFDPGLGVTFLLQAMHGLSFAASHLGAMAALAALAPEEARGRAQGIHASVVALAVAAATLASGPMYREAGPLLFAAMAPLGILGFLFTLLAIRTAAQPQRAREGG